MHTEIYQRSVFPSRHRSHGPRNENRANAIPKAHSLATWTMVGSSGYLKQATILPGVLVGRAPGISPSNLPRPGGKLAPLHPVRGLILRTADQCRGGKQDPSCHMLAFDHAGRASILDFLMLCVVRVGSPFFFFPFIFYFYFLYIALVVVTTMSTYMYLI